MPVFEISLPDGRAFEVEAPDQQSAWTGLQHSLSQAKTRETEASSGVAGKVNAAQQGLANMTQGVGETLTQLGAEGVGKTLTDTAGRIAPKDFKSEPLYTTEGGLKPANVGNVVAEAAPSLGAAAVLARLGSRVGGWKGALAALTAGAAAQSFGNTAKEVAAARTGDANAKPTTEDKLKAGVVEMSAAPVQAAGQLLLGPAGRFVGRLPATMAADAAGGAAAEAVRQAGARGSVDQGELINAGLTQGITSGVIAAPRGAGDAATTRLARKVDTPELRPATASVFDDLRAASGDKLRNTRAAGDALRQVTDGYNNELAALRNGAKGFSQAADNALARVTNDALSSKELAAIDTIGDANLSLLARKATVSRLLRETGTMTPSGKFVGGLSNRMEQGIRLFSNPLGTGVAAATGSAAAGGALPIGLPHLAALGGLYGAVRLADAATGARSPLARLSKRFVNTPRPSIPPANNWPPPVVPGQPHAPMQPPPAAPQPGGPGPVAPPMAPGAPWGRPPMQTVPNVGTPLRAPAPAPQAPLALPPPSAPAPRGTPPSPPTGPIPMGGPGQPRLEAPAMRMPGPPGTGLVPAPRALPAPQAPLALPKPSALYTEPPAQRLALPAPRAMAALAKLRAAAEGNPMGSGVPAEAVRAAAPAAPVIEKVTKSNGKVKVKEAPAPAVDDAIPDFLRRAPAKAAAPVAMPKAAPKPLEDLNPATRPQPKPRNASAAKAALDTLLKRQAERDAQAKNTDLTIPDFLQRTSQPKPAKAAEAKAKLEEKAAVDTSETMDLTHLSPREAAEKVADKWVKDGKKFFRGRGNFVGFIERVLIEKADVAEKLAEASGRPKANLQHMLWSMKTNAQAKAWARQMIERNPKAKDAFTDILGPKIDEWWKK